MTAIRTAIRIEAGSYEPMYWTFTDPDTGEPLDLTAGYTAGGVVSARSSPGGTHLLTLVDTDFRRTAEGRLYFEPTSVESAGWTFKTGYAQLELTHPSGETVRFHDSRLSVSPEL